MRVQCGQPMQETSGLLGISLQLVSLQQEEYLMHWHTQVSVHVRNTGGKACTGTSEPTWFRTSFSGEWNGSTPRSPIAVETVER